MAKQWNKFSFYSSLIDEGKFRKFNKVYCSPDEVAEEDAGQANEFHHF